MHTASWQKRLLGALSAAALSLGGVALADEPPAGTSPDTGGSAQKQAKEPEVEITDSKANKNQGEGTGGSGEAGVTDHSDDVTFKGAEEVGGREPGSSEDKRKALIGAESLSVQDPGNSESGPAMVDASEVKSPASGVGGSGDSERPELTVALTAGIDWYTGHLGGVMMNGFGYGLRVGGRFWDSVGLELEYSGTRAGVERDWAPQNGAAVWRNALDVSVTGGRTFESGIRPYGGIGFGVGRFNPNGFAEPTFNGDWFTEIPLIAGLDYQFGPLYAGLRGTWRFLGGVSFANEARGIDATGNMFGLALNIGGAF